MKERNTSIELLRIILMFVIVIFHVIGHGSNITVLGNEAFLDNGGRLNIFKLCFFSLLYFPVDCFIIISGYFGIKANISRAFRLWIQIFVVSIIIYFLELFETKNISVKSFIKACLPLRTDTWWFITCYFMLFIVSPCLNYFENLEFKNNYLVLGGLIFIDFYFSNYFLNFIVCYLIGIQLRKIDFKKVWFIIGVGGGVTIIQELLIVFLAKGNHVFYFIALNNYWPLTILQAISIFMLFKKITFCNKMINKISGSALGIYLFSDHPYIRGKIVNYLSKESVSFFKYIWFSFIIFIVSFGCSILVNFILEICNRRILIRKSNKNVETKFI